PLSQDSSNSQQVKDAIDIATVSGGTCTAHGLQQGRYQLLEGAGHRDGASKTIILLTDGLPTDVGSGQQALRIRDEGIRLITVGLYHTDLTMAQKGAEFVRIITRKAGRDSVSKSLRRKEFVDDPMSLDELAEWKDQIQTWLLSVSTRPGSIALR